MKTDQEWQIIHASIDALISYKKGNLNLTEANTLFSQMTGLGKNTAEKFLCGMSRNNVKKFNRKDSKNV